jgi:heme-degrading monooxygenase HmoA
LRIRNDDLVVTGGDEEVVVSVFTLGIWTIKPGHEEEFIEAWRDMATQTQAEFPDAHGTLLRDREAPNRFISFGPWESLEQVEMWRASAAFRDGVARMRELLDAFEPHTMDPTVITGKD